MTHPCFGPCNPSIGDYAGYIGLILVAGIAVALTYFIGRRLAASRVHRMVTPAVTAVVGVALAVLILPRYPRPIFVPSGVTAGLPGSGRTDAFYLEGNYFLTWGDASRPRLTCSVEADLIRADDGLRVLHVSSPPPTERTAGTTEPQALDRLRGGGYYLDVVSSCEWRLTLTPA
jgi:hypothetical protein